MADTHLIHYQGLRYLLLPPLVWKPEGFHGYCLCFGFAHIRKSGTIPHEHSGLGVPVQQVRLQSLIQKHQIEAQPHIVRRLDLPALDRPPNYFEPPFATYWKSGD